MDIMTLKKQIISNTINNFYVFTGNEIGIQNIYLNQMSNVLHIPIVRADTVSEVYDKCRVKSLFGENRAVYVVRGDADFTKNESAYTDVDNRIGNNVLVVQYEKIDNRLKFGKSVKDRTVVFDTLSENVLIMYIQKVVKLSNKNAQELSNEVSCSYDMAMNEVDKVVQYSQATGLSNDKAYHELIDSGVIYQKQETDVFKFVDSVCKRVGGLSVYLAGLLQESGVSAINILGTLYNTMKNILLVQCCEGSDISEITGIDNRQVYFTKKYLYKYDTSELVRNVKLIAKAVNDIKIGQLDEKYAVRYIIVKIM